MLKPTRDGRGGLNLTPWEVLDRLAYLVPPPRIHTHRYCGVLVPNATWTTKRGSGLTTAVPRW